VEVDLYGDLGWWFDSDVMILLMIVNIKEMSKRDKSI
jgi:hypothetical protein